MPDDFEPLCEHCGYTLTGLTTQTRCPECGEAFDVYSLPLARVPWLYRRRLGNITAYWKTVWQILRHPRAFADELCRPVRISAEDAKKFRRKSARIGMWSFGLTEIVFLLFMATMGHLYPSQWIILVIGLGFVALILYGFFLFATDLPTFIWSGLATDPHTLAPLHHYAAAPLALSPLLGIGLLGALAGDLIIEQGAFSVIPTHVTFGMALLVAGIVIALPVLFMIWRWPQILMRQATKCSHWRVLALALYLPIHWILIGFLATAGAAMIMGTIFASWR